MATLLIRCSLHDALPRDELRDWLRARRCELAGDPAIDDVEVAPLDDTTWVLGLEVVSPAAPEVADVVAGLLGDLRLLGLQPVVFRPEGVAALARDHA